MRQVFLEFDLAGAEWVIVAHLAQDPDMLAVYDQGLDAHVHTAHLMFGIPKEEIKRIEKEEPGPETPRQRGKRCNHGLNYDLGYKAFALRYLIPEGDAKDLVDRYHSAYPGVRRTFHRYVRDSIRRNGYLMNCLGRRRDFLGEPSDDLFRDAYAHIPQSTVADIMRRGLVHVYHNERLVQLMAQDHDSMTVQLPSEATLISDFVGRIIPILQPTLNYGGRDFVLGVDAKVGLTRGKRDLVTVTSDPGQVKEALEGLGLAA